MVAVGGVAEIKREDYFRACRGGRFRDPNLKATEKNLELLFRVLSAGDEQARRLNTCHYFQFSGSESEIWDPRFNARMAYEGFFTITTSRWCSVEPLPELQPFYSVVTWPNFEASRHVRQALRRLQRSGRQYCIVNNLNPTKTWECLDAYHRKKYGCNWLTRQYFEMLQAATADKSINFRLQCVELYEGSAAELQASSLEAGQLGVGDRVKIRESGRRGSLVDKSDAELPCKVQFDDGLLPHTDWFAESAVASAGPLAGEIGFSIGGVYTSLSGWTEERTSEGFGTAQLVLLGRWLQQHKFAFWSLGHCYSPEMDYKRQLGHRVVPRDSFLDLLRSQRGAFDVRAGDSGCQGDACALGDAEMCEASLLV